MGFLVTLQVCTKKIADLSQYMPTATFLEKMYLLFLTGTAVRDLQSVTLTRLG